MNQHLHTHSPSYHSLSHSTSCNPISSSGLPARRSLCRPTCPFILSALTPHRCSSRRRRRRLPLRLATVPLSMGTSSHPPPQSPAASFTSPVAASLSPVKSASASIPAHPSVLLPTVSSLPFLQSPVAAAAAAALSASSGFVQPSRAENYCSRVYVMQGACTV